MTWATFGKSSFSVTSGNLALHSSSPGTTRGHCAACGTTLTYEHQKRPDDIDITLPAFDDHAGLQPTCHIWVADKPDWVTIKDNLPQHQGWASDN